MRFNFKKISALATSALMVGMTAGIAAAANYPQPFIQSGASNVAIVVGTGSGVSVLDGIQAAKISDNLHSFASGTSSGGGASVSGGDAASLASGSSLLYLNDEFNTNVETLTKDDFATILADGIFTDDEGTDYDYDQIITVGSHANNHFAFSTSGNDLDDPALLLELGYASSGADPMYTWQIDFHSAVPFNATDSEGEEFVLFGKTYTVGTATDADTLVLLGGSDSTTVNVGETVTLTVDNTNYEVTLTGISSSDTAPSAGITINGESKTFTEGQTKTLGGVDVYVKTVFKTGDNAGYVEIQVGANKLTFESGKKVMYGADDTKMDGTWVTITGGVNAMTTMTIAISAEDNDADHVLVGDKFTDPIFSTLKIDFASVSNGPVFTEETDTSTARKTLSVIKNGNDELGATVTNAAGTTKSLPFTYNGNLADDTNTIHIVEGASMVEDDYFIIDSGNYQHFFQVTDISIDPTDTVDTIDIEDLFTGTTYTEDDTNLTATTGSIVISGQTYTITKVDTTHITITTSDYTSHRAVYPHMELVNSKDTRFAYTDKVTIFDDATAASNKTIDLPTGEVLVSFQDITGGQCDVIFAVTGGSSYTVDANATLVFATGIEDGITVGSTDYVVWVNETGGQAVDDACTAVDVTIALETTQTADGVDDDNTPGLLFVEDEDKSNEATTIVKNAVYLRTTDGGTYSYVNETLFTGTYDTATWDDTDFTGYLTNFGTYVLFDSSDTHQDFASLTYPTSQMYATVYFAEDTATITPGGPDTPGSTYNGVVITDKEVSGQSSKNLVIIGGSCINSAAATLVGGALCGTEWTDKTGVGVGQFLIKGYATNTLTSKLALLVAGYEEQDTSNAATYLKTQTVDTSKAYKGTSSTSAELIVETPTA